MSFKDESTFSQLDADNSVVFSNAEGDDNVVGTKDLETEERKNIARQESKAVVCWRVVVYLVVLVVAISVSLLVYLYTKRDQEEEFETRFESYADKVMESFYHSVERKLGAIQTLSTTITSHALSTGMRFPNVTIPDFELRAAHTRIQADGVLIYWLPLVTDETRAGWEEYAKANRHWLMDSFIKELGWKAAQDTTFGLGAPPNDQEGGRKLQDENATAPQPGQVTEEDGFNPIIYGGFGDPKPYGSGPFLPLWQLSPVLPVMSFLNYDILDHGAVAESLYAGIDSQQVVMGKANDLRDPNLAENETSVSLYNAFLTAGQYRHDTEVYEGDPTTNLVVPVLIALAPIELSEESSTLSCIGD